MEYTFILTLSILIFLGVFGSYLLWKNITIKLEKNLSNQISALIIDGIKIYGLRAFSAIFQLLLYTSIVLFILSKILNKQFLWDQIGAFFLGGITMSICLFILSGIIPKLIPKILEKSKIYLANCMTIQFETVFSLGFISVSILITNALLLIYFTSYKLLIGYSLELYFQVFSQESQEAYLNQVAILEPVFANFATLIYLKKIHETLGIFSSLLPITSIKFVDFVLIY